MTTASEFLERIKHLSGLPRERAILSAFLGGQYPAWTMAWTTLRITGGPYTLEIDVTPSYLAVGTDDDWVRMPMTPFVAQRIADEHQATLPTKKLVDDIYHACAVRLPQVSIAADRSSSTAYGKHQALVEARRGRKPRGPLAGGEKKDVVLASGLAVKPGKVAIYGWHGLTGHMVQPLFAGHAARYVDYSHGVRLIRRAVRLDGAARDLLDIATDPVLFRLTQADGPLRFLRYPSLP